MKNYNLLIVVVLVIMSIEIFAENQLDVLVNKRVEARDIFRSKLSPNDSIHKDDIYPLLGIDKEILDFAIQIDSTSTSELIIEKNNSQNLQAKVESISKLNIILYGVIGLLFILGIVLLILISKAKAKTKKLLLELSTIKNDIEGSGQEKEMKILELSDKNLAAEQQILFLEKQKIDAENRINELLSIETVMAETVKEKEVLTVSLKDIKIENANLKLELLSTKEKIVELENLVQIINNQDLSSNEISKALQNKIEELEASLQIKNNEVLSSQEVANVLQTTISELQKSLQNKSNEDLSTSETAKAMQEKIENLENLLESKEKETLTQNEKTNSLQLKIDELQQIIAANENSNTLTESQQAAINQQVEEHKIKIQELIAERTVLQEANKYLKEDLEEYRKENNQILDEKEDYVSDLKKFEDSKEIMEKNFENFKIANTALSIENANLLKQIELLISPDELVKLSDSIKKENEKLLFQLEDEIAYNEKLTTKIDLMEIQIEKMELQLSLTKEQTARTLNPEIIAKMDDMDYKFKKLEKLNRMLEINAITQEEYDLMKQQIISEI